MMVFSLNFYHLLCVNVQVCFGRRYSCSNKRPWWHKYNHIFLYLSLSLFLSFFSFACTFIVLWLTGYSQPVMEMSCGAWGGVAWCGKLVDEWVFVILTHMHNLTWYTLCGCIIVVMANVYVCMSVYAQYPACVAIELSYSLCPVSILLFATGLGVLAVPAGPGTITSPPSRPLVSRATMHHYGRHSQKQSEMGVAMWYQRPESPQRERVDKIRCVMCSVLSHQLWFNNKGKNSIWLSADMTCASHTCKHFYVTLTHVTRIRNFHPDWDYNHKFGRSLRAKAKFIFRSMQTFLELN